jgi:Spy/CpxP family protein refolding chaperone
MNEFKPLLRPALVAGALLLSAAAYAQALEKTPPSPAPRFDMKPPPLPGERIEAELAYMNTALTLNDAQLPAWERVADVFRATAKRRDAEIRLRQSAQEKNGNSAQIVVKSDLIDRLEHLQQIETAENDDLAKLLTVLKPFYATLTDQQKTIADEIVRPGPGGLHAFGAAGMGMPVFFHGPMGPPPLGRDCRPGPER